MNNSISPAPSASGTLDTWFLWEPDNPPPLAAWYQVLLADGEEISAIYRPTGAWWCLAHGHVNPQFWRDAPYLPNQKSRDSRPGSR